MHQKKSLSAISASIKGDYWNSAIASVNDHCLRMAVFQSAYRWHYHEHTDELFIVLEGALHIEFKDSEPITLYPGESCCIPKGTVHKTSAAIRTVNLTFEKAGEDTVFLD